MTKNYIINEYFEWLFDFVNDRRHRKYRKLIMALHSTEFRYTISNDSNRAKDGKYLRYRFANERGYSDILDIINGPCSVLEMILGLSIRCEEQIMDDPDIGNRTSQWFWDMIENLDLIVMTDDAFDRGYFDEVITRFLDRKYHENGVGGLFTIRCTRYDLRTVEIWQQMCWYLNSIM